MKKYVMGASLLLLSGCTQVVISDRTYIRDVTPVAPAGALRDFPLNAQADMDCQETNQGVAGPGVALIKITCTNRRRLGLIANSLVERGYRPVKPTDDKAPTMTLKVQNLNGFLEGTTGFLNVFTLGILPLYHHEYHTATYRSPTDNVEITRQVKIWSTTSWVSLFLPNSGRLSKDEIRARAEKNLLRTVLDDAKFPALPAARTDAAGSPQAVAPGVAGS